MAELDATGDLEGRMPSDDEVALLDALPYVAVNLAEAPENQLRRLFENLQFTVRLIGDTNQVHLEIRLPAEDLPEVTNTVETTGCVDAVRAPAGTTKGWERV
ncbi:hypothetical protein FHX82_003929 [Amycolatopsis bartoniae]|uniref:Uncharacterized protein n=1 Tax=Amycolatopsis bartoniae TaxID=941986 RepID=A0A8H9MDA7_9PSEU|nr:hypothetical protein [Amycolatopsis bartoniae]MBB2936865.1 hypothetical protein [Amycolatopsis bartoniae]TVT07243.1 hypothetical protein FNH07_16990 [Amycolatopsis bartoniae]GHF50743.1 hypothetical protein GCM10017566_24830 [Amycolatopsis bartoniae]